MPRTLRSVSVAFAVALAALLAACAPTASEPMTVDAATVIIDVRTPAEYAAGHLEGAVNLDVQSGAFDAAIAELPTDGDYIVYCRSGNRAATAAAEMARSGFTQVRNAGGLDAAASATGLPIVQ